MNSLIAFLECLGAGAHSQRSELDQVIAHAQLDADIVQAMLRRDAAWLNRATGATDVVSCLIFPAEDEPQQQPEQPDETPDSSPSHEESTRAA